MAQVSIVGPAITVRIVGDVGNNIALELLGGPEVNAQPGADSVDAVFRLTSTNDVPTDIPVKDPGNPDSPGFEAVSVTNPLVTSVNFPDNPVTVPANSTVDVTFTLMLDQSLATHGRVALLTLGGKGNTQDQTP